MIIRAVEYMNGRRVPFRGKLTTSDFVIEAALRRAKTALDAQSARVHHVTGRGRP